MLSDNMVRLLPGCDISKGYHALRTCDSVPQYGAALTQMRQQQRLVSRFVRFGIFEVDLQERTLTKAGGRVHLQEQPLRILTLLLERPCELVTREEIRDQVWQRDIFVGFDAALNTAMRKLREALNDSAENPRFLET